MAAAPGGLPMLIAAAGSAVGTGCCCCRLLPAAAASRRPRSPTPRVARPAAGASPLTGGPRRASHLSQRTVVAPLKRGPALREEL